MADGFTLSGPKFQDPRHTAKGEKRAAVSFRRFETLWFNTGTLCNIACANCYIESSPQNDRLSYLTLLDIEPFLDELERLGESPCEIGFTGGEPFLNPDMIALAEAALARGHNVLILTNAMRPMMRKAPREGLLRLKEAYGARLQLRVSLDHHTKALHEKERGDNTWAPTLEGLSWLAAQGFEIRIAGRTCWGENEAAARRGYKALFDGLGLALDPQNREHLVLFPEMEPESDPPEITTACWDILNVDPGAMMCATSRMVVKRKGESAPVVLPCTLLPYDKNFECGKTLGEALDPTPLNHPYCATFCVLGGGSCSAAS